MEYDVTAETLQHYVQRSAQLEFDLVQARLIIKKLESQKAGEASGATS
jgi:hypothetical protein